MGALALSVVGMVAAYRLGRARADGVPAMNPLYYGGVLNDGGRPVEGTRSVTVRLWNAATAGTTVCTTNAGSTAFSGGRFRVALDATCVGAVRANPELWAEVQVEGTTFPRSKLGAVPYALEAGRASAASGGLETRIATVERRPAGRQVVIGSWRPTSPAVDRFSVPCPTFVDGGVSVPLVGPQFTLTFTATASAYYQIQPAVSSVEINGGSGGNFEVRMLSTPPLGRPLTVGARELYLLAEGQTYTISHEIRVSTNVVCTVPLTGVVMNPIVIEQFN